MGLTEHLQSSMQDAPESLDALVAKISPSIYEQLKQAVELGRWADGSRLGAEQLEHSMQLVILYEAKRLPEDQRTGAALQSSCKSSHDEPQATPLTISQAGKQQ